MLAALNGHEAVVDALIAAGADVKMSAPASFKLGIVDFSKRLGNCYTASMLAAVAGHRSIVVKVMPPDQSRECAPAGLFPLAVMGRQTESSSQRETALFLKPLESPSPLAAMVASVRGHQKLAAELGIELGPGYMTRSEAIEWTGPAIALTDSFDELLDDLGAGDLWTAAVRGNIARIDELLQSGADVNATNKSGETALIRAAAYADSQKGVLAVRALLGKGAAVNLKDREGKTALARAQKRKDKAPEIVKVLKDAGGK